MARFLGTADGRASGGGSGGGLFTKAKVFDTPGTTTFEIEITYRKNDLIDKKNNDELINEISNDLIKIGFLDNINKINFFEIKKFTHAYVIYNLQHRKTVDFLKNALTKGPRLQAWRVNNDVNNSRNQGNHLIYPISEVIN